MIEIKLTKGFSAYIDDCDQDLSEYSWYATNEGYAARSVGSKKSGNRKMIYLHRVILERKIDRPLLPTEIADHINRKVGDNSRNNLRISDYSQSVHNTTKKHDALYKGISYNKRDNLWSSKVMFHRISHDIGRFETPEIAARAYDIYAMRFHGEYASLNFPNEIEKTIEWWSNYIPSAQKNNSLFLRGVWKNGEGWSARITIDGKRIYLGCFSTPEDAHEAYKTEYLLHKK